MKYFFNLLFIYMKDIFKKDNIKKCTPIYGILIFMFFTYFGTFVIFKNIDQITKELIIYIICKTLVFILYISLVLYLCHKKHKKAAYIVSYFPLVSILLLGLFIYYETFGDIMNSIKGIEESSGQSDETAQGDDGDEGEQS